MNDHRFALFFFGQVTEGVLMVVVVRVGRTEEREVVGEVEEEEDGDEEERGCAARWAERCVSRGHLETGL